jgi:hypothetical protein
MVNTSKFIKDKICELVDQPKFRMYIEKLPLQGMSIRGIQTIYVRPKSFLQSLFEFEID